MVEQQWVLALNAAAAHHHALQVLASLFARRVILLYPLLLIWLWWRRRPGPRARLLDRQERSRHVLLLAVLAAVLALIANGLVGKAVTRPRPYRVLPVHVLIPSPGRNDTSFPSDHAAVAGAIAATLWMGGEGAWGAASMAGAVAIGVARLAAGVHYPSDILGGLIVGIVCAWIALGLRHSLRPVLDGLIALARRSHLA